MKKVKDFMKKDMPLLYANTPIQEIIDAFSQSSHNILPVVGVNNVLEGLVTIEEIIEDFVLSKEEAPLLEKLHFLADFFSETFENLECVSPLIVAGDIMQENVISVKEEDSVLKAAILMKKKDVNRLIAVNDKNQFVGYISRNEICRAFIC